MKIVAVAACTSGIAHTYIAKEKLIRAAEALGHEIHVETQGTIGTEDELKPEQIQEADVVILAVDIAITGTERFEGKKQVKVPTSNNIRRKEYERVRTRIKKTYAYGYFLYVAVSSCIRFINCNREFNGRTSSNRLD